MEYDCHVTGSTEFLNLQTTMRPPRVAILFEGYGAWRAWARHAISAASRTWGGGGHALVPYSADGSVHPLVLDAVESFDPDHVLLYRPTLAEREAVEPGSVRITGQDGALLTDDERTSVVRGSTFVLDPSDAGRRARELVASRCSPFLASYGGDRYPREAHRWIDARSSGGLVAADQFLPGTPLPSLAPDPRWSSDAALWAAALNGLPPDPWASGMERQEPSPADLWRWNLGSGGLLAAAPPPYLWIGGAPGDNESGDTPSTWFTRLDAILTVLRYGYPAHTGVAVIGDTAADFGLAAIYRAILGTSHWLPDELLAEQETTMLAAWALRELQRRAEDAGSGSTITSASLSASDLSARVADINRWALTVVVEDAPEPESPSLEPPSLTDGLQSRYLSDGMGDRLAVPVRRESDGTMEMLTLFAPPVPTSSGLLPDSVYWLVDIQPQPQLFPSARGLPPKALLGSLSNELPPAVRSSRNGITLDAKSHGFIASGTVLSGRLAHPSLRFPGLRDWADAMATREGLVARYSPAGQRAQYLGSRLGSRQALSELVDSSFLVALRMYARDESRKRAKSAGRNAEIADLDGDRAYLSIDAIAHAAGFPTSPDVRTALDLLCRARLARRGLVLKCDECGRPSFHSIDLVGQSYRCPRCDTSNELDAASWHSGAPEPTWFYDLHSTLRDFIDENGDIPLLAARRLQASARAYGDCAELELRSEATAVAELDLLAHVDGQVVVLEAKRSNRLASTSRERGRKAQKLALAAKLLRADVVCLATAQATWNQTDINEVTAAVRRECGDRVEIKSMVELAPKRVPEAPITPAGGTSDG